MKGISPHSEGSGKRRSRWMLEWQTVPLMPSRVQLEWGGGVVSQSDSEVHQRQILLARENQEEAG